MGFSCNDCATSFSKYCFIALSAVSCLFFMIGALGYTHVKDTMKNISWFYLTYPGTEDNIYYSLKSQYVEQYNAVGDYSTSNLSRYEKCDSDGYGAYVLVVIACICSLCCAFLSGALIKNDFTFGQFIGCGLAGLATFFSGIALAIFMGDCKKAIVDWYPSDLFDDHWGAGAILTATGMVMMFFVSLGMFLTAKFCAAGNANGNRIPDEPVDRMTAV